jgi:hypothetical protein
LAKGSKNRISDRKNSTSKLAASPANEQSSNIPPTKMSISEVEVDSMLDRISKRFKNYDFRIAGPVMTPCGSEANVYVSDTHLGTTTSMISLSRIGAIDIDARESGVGRSVIGPSMMSIDELLDFDEIISDIAEMVEN